MTTERDELQAAWTEGLWLVGQGDADQRTIGESLDWTFGVLESLDTDAADGLRPDVEAFQNADDDDPIRDTNDILDDVEVAVTEALPDNVRKYFSYGTSDGYIGLLPHEEYEELLAEVV